MVPISKLSQRPAVNNRPKYSHRYLARRVQEFGLSRQSAALAVRATMRAIHLMLVEGYPVTLPKIGLLYFRRRKGRVIHTTNPRFRAPRVQPDSVYVDFKPSPFLHKELKTVTPKHVSPTKLKPAGWSAKKGK